MSTQPITITVRWTGRRVWYQASSPYAARDLMRMIPGREWNPARKVWSFPGWALDEARQILGAWDGGVQWPPDLPPQEPYDYDSPGTSGVTTTTTTMDWAAHMFAHLDPRLHDQLFKGVAKAIHPDHGGDTAEMQVLLAARDKYLKKPA